MMDANSDNKCSAWSRAQLDATPMGRFSLQVRSSSLALKLSFAPERVRDITALLIDISVARVDAPTQPVEAITGDPDDDVVLACGVNADVQIIVSGDRRHMLPVREHPGIRIISPQALLAELAGSR
jgi:predicted nucleic acid-binding protein